MAADAFDLALALLCLSRNLSCKSLPCHTSSPLMVLSKPAPFSHYLGKSGGTFYGLYFQAPISLPSVNSEGMNQ